MIDPRRERDETAASKLSPTEARQAQPMGRVRYILAISLCLSCAGLAAVWVFGLF